MNEQSKRQIAVVVNDDDLRPILKNIFILIVKRNSTLREEALKALDKEINEGEPSDIIKAMTGLTAVAAQMAVELQDVAALVHQMNDQVEEEELLSPMQRSLKICLICRKTVSELVTGVNRRSCSPRTNSKKV